MERLEEFHDPDLISERLAFHRDAIAEEEEAKEVCEAMLAGPPQWWRSAVHARGGTTAGMVTVLIQRSEAALRHSPPDALAIIELAVAVAAELGTDDYPYKHVLKVRGQAMRQQAFVLTYLGRLPEAERIAGMAGELLEQIPIPLIELARLDLVRSNIASNLGKYDEAIAYARSAGETYGDFGNQRWLQAAEYEAAAYYCARNYRRALELWRTIEEHVALLGRDQQATLLYNIGACAGALGDFDEAARRYAAAAEAFERAGLLVQRVKCLHGLGLAMLETGRYDEAIVVLEKAFDQLDTLGMEHDASLAALSRVEALLAAGRPEEVPAICRMLLERFTRAGVTGAAMTALAYLRETVSSGHATPMSARTVHDFIRDTHRGCAPTTFTPPVIEPTTRMDG